MAQQNLPHVPLSSDDFIDLVAEIAADEALAPHLATSEACEIEQSLIAYAAIWDSWVWGTGNPTAFAWF